MYRYGVGAVIINQEGKIFVGNRIDNPSSWQMPQGGIDMNEDNTKALLREIKEETGISSIKILHCTNELSYNFPEHIKQKFYNGKYIGQKQIWFFCEFLGKENEINLKSHHEQEFLDYKWVNKEELLQDIVSFKKDLYEKIIQIGIDNKLIN